MDFRHIIWKNRIIGFQKNKKLKKGGNVMTELDMAELLESTVQNQNFIKIIQKYK